MHPLLLCLAWSRLPIQDLLASNPRLSIMHSRGWLAEAPPLHSKVSGRLLSHPSTAPDAFTAKQQPSRDFKFCWASEMELSCLHWIAHTKKTQKIYSLQAYLQQCFLFLEDRLIKNIKDCDASPLPESPLHPPSSLSSLLCVYLLLEAHFKA